MSSTANVFTKVNRDGVIYNSLSNSLANGTSFVSRNLYNDISDIGANNTAIGLGGYLDGPLDSFIFHSGSDGSANLIFDLSGDALGAFSNATLDGVMQVTGNRVDFSGVQTKMVLPNPSTILRVDNGSESTLESYISSIAGGTITSIEDGPHKIDVCGNTGIDISSSALTLDGFESSAGITIQAGGVTVEGGATISGDILLISDNTLNSINVTDNEVNVTGSTTICGDSLLVSDNTFYGINVTDSGITVTGATTIAGSLTVEGPGDTTITGNLTVTGTTTQTTIIRNQLDVSDNIIRVNQAGGLVRDSGFIFMNVTDASNVNSGNADVSNAALFFDADSGAATGNGEFVLGFVTANDHSGANPFTLVSDPSGTDTSILADLRMGTLTCTEVNSVSDLRLKKDIKPINNAMSTLNKLRPVSYKWNQDAEHSPDQIGLIAQEIEEVLPSLVSTNKDGMKAVAYQKLTALLIEAVKEQQKQINELKEKYN